MQNDNTSGINQQTFSLLMAVAVELLHADVERVEGFQGELALIEQLVHVHDHAAEYLKQPRTVLLLFINHQIKSTHFLNH